MDIKKYLASEGIKGRLTAEEFRSLKAAISIEGQAEFENDFNDAKVNPNKSIKEHYELLAKYGLLNKSRGLLFEEIVAHAPAIAQKINGYKRVLDAGCGDALKLAYYAHECPDSSFLGIDYGLESIALAEARIKKLQLQNVELKVLDISAVEQLSENFDCITATNMLHERRAFSYNYFGGGDWRQDIASGICYLSNVLKSHGRFMFTLHFSEKYVKDCIADMEINPGLEFAGLEVEEQTDILFNHFDNKKINGLWVCRKK